MILISIFNRWYTFFQDSCLEDSLFIYLIFAKKLWHVLISEKTQIHSFSFLFLIQICSQVITTTSVSGGQVTHHQLCCRDSEIMKYNVLSQCTVELMFSFCVILSLLLLLKFVFICSVLIHTQMDYIYKSFYRYTLHTCVFHPPCGSTLMCLTSKMTEFQLLNIKKFHCWVL